MAHTETEALRERVKEIREAATKSAQNHPWVEYVTFLLTELDAARAREQALAETFNERVNWIQVVEARWRSAEAREAAWQARAHEQERSAAEESNRADAAEAREAKFREALRSPEDTRG